MNIIRSKSIRGMAIALLTAAGIVTTLATGGSSGSIAPPPPPSAGPTLPITADNGFNVSSALLIALGVSFDLGDVTGDEILPSSLLPPDAVAGVLPFDTFLSGTMALAAQVPDNCLVSGTRDVTAVLADPNTVTIGDSITAVFVECDDNEGYVISGTVVMTVADYDGDILTDVFLLSVDVVMTGVEIVEGSDSITTSGDYTLTLDSLDFPVVSIRLAGSELRFNYNGVASTLTDFDQYLQSDGSVFPDTKTAEAMGRLSSVVLGGSMDYETIVPIQAVGDYDPHAGEILITGADNSNVRIVIVDGSNVVLEIDANGDGVVDLTIDTSWAELNNQTSSINSSTAPVIAREVIYGIAGFGSVTVTAGGQFQMLGAFGLLQQQSVSGTFGPLDIACAISGTASISGFIATAGSYAADDNLAANFSACANGGEVLTGQLDFAIASYDTSVGGAYRVTGTVAESGLDRNAGGLLFQGNGAFDTIYDYFYTVPGKIFLTATASSFAITAGGASRQLSAASVLAEITAGQPPVEISRTSSGHITSAAMVGSYYYESLVPDIVYLDTDPTTGPVSGELLVRAADNSTMLIRAISETFVRLEIDLDGDTVVDSSIDTTWAALL